MNSTELFIENENAINIRVNSCSIILLIYPRWKNKQIQSDTKENNNVVILKI